MSGVGTPSRASSSRRKTLLLQRRIDRVSSITGMPSASACSAQRKRAGQARERADEERVVVAHARDLVQADAVDVDALCAATRSSRSIVSDVLGLFASVALKSTAMETSFPGEGAARTARWGASPSSTASRLSRSAFRSFPKSTGATSMSFSSGCPRGGVASAIPARAGPGRPSLRSSGTAGRPRGPCRSGIRRPPPRQRGGRRSRRRPASAHEGDPGVPALVAGRDRGGELPPVLESASFTVSIPSSWSRRKVASRFVSASIVSTVGRTDCPRASARSET